MFTVFLLSVVFSVIAYQTSPISELCLKHERSENAIIMVVIWLWLSALWNYKVVMQLSFLSQSVQKKDLVLIDLYVLSLL